VPNQYAGRVCGSVIARRPWRRSAALATGGLSFHQTELRWWTPSLLRPAFLSGPVPSWIRSRRERWRCRSGVSRPFLAADVSPRHRTAIDCQTRAARLFYCSVLDRFATFASSSVALTSSAHGAKELRVDVVRQPPTEQSPSLRCPRRPHVSCRCKQRQQGIWRTSDLCLLHDSLLNYVALAPLSPAIGPATNRDDLQLTIYSNSCVVVVSESCGRALLRPDRLPQCTKHLRSAYRSERGG
jgi:hypothetical protein